MTPQEEWRPVVGLEGRYEVSSLGRVRSVDRWIHDSDGRRSRFFRGVLISQYKGSGYGYMKVKLYSAGSPARVSTLVHRLVAEAFFGPCPVGMEVLHGPGGSLDNSVGNLRYGTSSENKLDTNRDGTNWWRNHERCPRGHLLRAPNLVASVARRGHRECLACSRAKANVHDARKRHGIELDLAFEADRHYARIIAASRSGRQEKQE